MSQEVTYQSYWGFIDSVVNEIKEEVKSGDLDKDDVYDRVHETADGSQYCIYTHYAMKCLEFSQNEDEYFEQFGNLDAESFSDAMCKMAFYALRADIEQRLGNVDDLEVDSEDTGNAGCDACGMDDRMEGSKYCEDCAGEDPSV